MYRFKGFVQIRTLISNSANAISPIGELSASALTFAKDVKIYGGVRQDVQLHAYSSKLGTSDEGIDDLIIARSIEVAEWIVSRQSTLTAGETLLEFKLAIESAFSANCSSFEIGDLIEAGDGKLYPSFITWSTDDYVQENLCTLYLSNSTFERLYDEYTIDVIPPITPIDTFFSAYNDVVTTISTMGYVENIELIQARRGAYPETILTAEQYDYYNPNNTTIKNKTNWTFLIYGPKGNDPDAIKQALLDYIARNSNQTIDKWKVIFPDIFKSTEFLFFPFWKNMAVSEMSATSGIYSPFTVSQADAAWVKSKTPSITAAHFNTHFSLMPRPYRSLMLGVIGSAENRNGNMFLNNVYRDMICVSSTSLDFNRMSANTQKFLEKLDDLLYRADIHTPNMDLPSGYRRATRDNVVFITVMIQNIRFMVATKDSLNT